MLPWIALTFPLWVGRSPSRTGGSREEWQRAMYAAVLTFLVTIWIVKELSPTTRMPTAALVVGPITFGLMLAAVHYLRSEYGRMTLARYAAMDTKLKVLVGAISSALYVGIFLRVADLGTRYHQFTS